MMRYIRLPVSFTPAVVLLACVPGTAFAQTANGAGKSVDGPSLSAASVAAGRSLYLQNCASCHGPNGKAEVQAMSIAADLSEPAYFKSGSTDAAIFATLANGRGNGMPGFSDTLTEKERWQIISFVKSLWPKDAVPISKSGAMSRK